MSASVDVLAVIETLGRGNPLYTSSAENAHAKVAELFEATRDLLADIGFRIDDPRARKLDRVCAALAASEVAK